MRDCEGGNHHDEEPITWWQFRREMAHRDRLEKVKEDALRDALDLRARQMLLSHRIIVVILGAITILMQVLFYFGKR